MKKMLADIRIVDFTWALTGPIAAKHFSDLGAEVIKIESRARLDMQRTGAQYGSFNQHNTGKLDITLNLKKPEGLKLVKQLIAKSDVVMENFARKRHGEDGLKLRSAAGNQARYHHGKFVHAGANGAVCPAPGIGFRLTALSGFNHITGWPGPGAGVDRGLYKTFVAPRFIILAVMAALEYRRHTGKGQYLDASQFEAGVQLMAPLLLDYQQTGSRWGGGETSAPTPPRTTLTAAKGRTGGARLPCSPMSSGRPFVKR